MAYEDPMLIPLRVRISTQLDKQLEEARQKLGLSRSVFVRWALTNSIQQVLTPNNTPAAALTSPKRKRALAAPPVASPQEVVYSAPADEAPPEPPPAILPLEHLFAPPATSVEVPIAPMTDEEGEEGGWL